MSDTSSPTAPDSPAADEANRRPSSSQVRTRAPITFGKYELVRRVRVGGMAEIFQARELEPPHKLVALKRILPSFTDEADYVAMFIDEARLGLRLKHRGIVDAYELGQVEDAFYIALEYVDGQDAGALLRRARERSEPLPIGIACYIARELCEALDYAHELRDENDAPLGIVHRDVSPQNVLVSYEGAVKLIDFGIAKSTDQLMRTQAGLLKGKHGYLSPEQALGAEVDRRSDLFSLGICLYEMLSARRLFQGQSDFSTLMRVRGAQVPLLSEVVAAVPERLARIVERALAREPEQRFASAAEFGSALDEFLATWSEPADRAALAQFMRDAFGGPSEASDAQALETPSDSATGLLDAFDDVAPISTVSALSASVSAAPQSELVPPAAKATLPDWPAPVEALAEKRAAPAESEASEPDSTEAVTAEEPLRELAAAGLAEPAAGPVEPALGAAFPRAAIPVEEYAPHAPAHVVTLPGIGMEWDDEELSTQIYDPPEREGLAPVVAIPVRTARQPVPVVAEPPAAAPTAQPPQVERPRPATGAGVWIGAVLLSVLAIGSAFFFLSGAPATGTLQLTTSPADARVTLDGRLADSTSSPFVFASVDAEVKHKLEVSKPGYRSWSAVLSLQPGKVLELPRVELIPEAPAEPPAPTGNVPVAPSEPPAATNPPTAEPPRAHAPAPMQRVQAPVQVAPKPVQKPRPVEPVQAQTAVAPPAGPAAAAAESTTGILRINSRPWSRVYVDGRLIGTTPQMGIVLGGGLHTVTLVNPDFGLERVLSVQIEPGKTLTRSVDLNAPAQ